MGTVVVVGASLAGAHAARGLRQEGFEGRLVLVGAEPHPPYDRPPLSKRFLASGDESLLELPALGQLDELGVECHLGVEATGLDLGRRVVQLGEDRELGFDGLVLATGCAARRLGGVGHLAGVHVLRSLDDARALGADLGGAPRRVVVVGAGFIGLEVAATCRERGLEVTVVDVASAPIEHALGAPMGHALGAPMGHALGAVHRDHGVDLRLATGIEAFEGGDRVERVRFTDGAVLDADVVVVGIGVRPATGWLEGSGLVLDDGVLCDETCLAAPGVVVAGDVARWPNATFGGELMRVEHWEHAVEMGGYAARRLLAGQGAIEPFAPVPWFWSDQYDRKIQLSGRPRSTDEVTLVAGSVEERRFAAMYERDGRVVAVLGVNRPRQVVLGRALVGRRAPTAEALDALAG
ncbi:MAG: FAD-dependent oxidoreductase [Acidimicrobiia bacterium]|nr:FAD-dependent oxidoreductase [Acidimicrobiia bacterium]